MPTARLDQWTPAREIAAVGGSLWSAREATPLARVACGKRRGFEAIAQRHDDVINVRRHDRLCSGNPFDGRVDYRGRCGISEKPNAASRRFAKKRALSFLTDTLARQLSQLREWRIDRAGTDVAGVLDHTVEPAIDIENRTFAHLAIRTIGFARRKAQTTNIAQPSADGPLHRLRHRSVMHADGIVEIGLHERQHLGAIVVRIWLVGDAAIVGVADAPAVVAARAG